jgi:hypothetical protein
MTTKTSATSPPESRRARRAGGAPPVPDHRVHREQDDQNERGHREQLEEAVARVLSVRQVRTGLDQCFPAEEVAELHEHEGEEERVQRTEGDGDLGCAERERNAFVSERRWRDQPFLFPDREEVAQEACAQPGGADGDQDVLERVVERGQRIGDEALEHGVRRDEEPAEQSQQREAERDAAKDGRHSIGADRSVDIFPVDVLVQEVDGACRGRGAGGYGAGRVVGDGGPVNAGSRTPERPERERARERKEVHGDEQRRVSPEEGGREDEQGREHPAPALMQRRPPQPQEQSERRREGDRPEQDVES